MNPSPDNLENFIHRTLRSLPDRRAPRSLEARVLAAIVANRALPWWKRSFSGWPVVVRGLFLLFSGALVALLVGALTMWDFKLPDFSETFANPLAILESLRSTGRALADFCAILVRSIPAPWLYGGLAGLVSLYVTVFGLGATAYRTLYSNR